ncbi:MAG: anti-sigma factor [Erythrobacter sp.]|nr:MAG: anti-sigma factor [Erythrobacter sp.]
MTDEAALTPRETLAAEFVLGLLTGEDLLRARGMLARDPDFAGEVARWEEHFAPLLDQWEEHVPPPALWERIDAATRIAEGAPLTQPTDIAALRKSRDRWRLAGGLGIAAAAVLALVVLTGPAMQEVVPAPSAVDAPLLAANIPIGETPLRLALTYVPGRDELSVSSAGLEPDGVHDHELWLVDRQGGLHSLGVIVPGAEARFAVAPDLADEFGDGTRLVLTREPLGGKPADAAAGPVVAEGQFTAI